MIRKRCLRLLSHWLYVDEKLQPTSINPYKKRLVKWFTYDGFVCFSTFLSRRWIVFNIILLLLTQKVCMYTIYMDWIYSLKPNNSIQKDDTNRLNKNTNRQRYAYIVIPEKIKMDIFHYFFLVSQINYRDTSERQNYVSKFYIHDL